MHIEYLAEYQHRLLELAGFYLEGVVGAIILIAILAFVTRRF